jgi:osmoprotectant transport system permease protein
MGGLWPKISPAHTDNRPRIIVGATTFSEQYILSRVIAKQLDDAGFNTSIKESLGSIILFDALTRGLVDCYVDYSGTIWANSMGMTEIPGRQEVLDSMSSWLWETHQVKCLGSLGFENRYALAMRGAHADSLQIRTIQDLALHSSKLTIAGDYEFFVRPEWTSLEATYKLDFDKDRRRALDAALMYSAVAAEQVDVISAYSTDGRIADLNLAVLDDPLQALPPYDAVLLLSPDASQDPAVVRALTKMIMAITDEQMRNANRLVDVDGLPIDSAVTYVRELLK